MHKIVFDILLLCFIFPIKYSIEKNFLLVLSVLLLFPTIAQQNFFDNYVYQGWDTFAGIKRTTATDLIQTKDGYLNIGTYEGLVRSTYPWARGIN